MLRSSFFRTRIFLIIITTVICACDKAGIVADTEPIEKTVLPGECFKSTSLCFAGLQESSFMYTSVYTLPFLFDENDIYYDKVSLGAPYSVRDFSYRPSEEAYRLFADNANTVHSIFEDYLQDIMFEAPENFQLSTIFYDSGISLIGDKDFAGFKAGENIVADAMDYPTWYSAKEKSVCILDFLYPADHFVLPIDDNFTYRYALCYRGVSIRVPQRNFRVIDDDVTFTLTIPVKIGLYLTWINDKIANPDAPFPYREEVLTCTFTIHKRLL